MKYNSSVKLVFNMFSQTVVYNPNDLETSTHTRYRGNKFPCIEEMIISLITVLNENIALA